MEIKLENDEDYISLIVLEYILQDDDWMNKRDEWHRRICRVWRRTLHDTLNLMHFQGTQGKRVTGRTYQLPLCECYQDLLKEDGVEQ